MPVQQNHSRSEMLRVPLESAGRRSWRRRLVDAYLAVRFWFAVACGAILLLGLQSAVSDWEKEAQGQR
ncbi:hypothetical protein [Cupriavidus sp. Marseille-Q8015]